MLLMDCPVLHPLTPRVIRPKPRASRVGLKKKKCRLVWIGFTTSKKFKEKKISQVFLSRKRESFPGERKQLCFGRVYNVK